MYDLIKEKIYHFEKIEKLRKWYEKTDAIYFISPHKDSIKYLLWDYETKIKAQYGAVHLCFAGHVNNDQLKAISGTKELVARLHTFKEINLDFNFFENNIFTFNMWDGMFVFPTPLSDPYLDHYLQNIAWRLFTVCSTLLEKPYIWIQANSPYAEKVARHFDRIMSDFKPEQAYPFLIKYVSCWSKILKGHQPTPERKVVEQ